MTQDRSSTPPNDEKRFGYWAEFNRGWWRRGSADNGLKRSEQSAGIYHGSVTEEQAKELEHIVRDYLETGAQPPRLTAYGMREFIARAIAYWKAEPGDKAKEEAAEMRAMLERTPQSEKVASDPGTEKLLRDLLDRGYKMHVQAGSLRVAEQNANHNDPLIAWLSDVRALLYGNTKPTPRGI